MRTPHDLLKTLREDLIAHRDEGYRAGSRSFFKESINPIGVRSQALKGIMARHRPAVKALEPRVLLSLCDELWASGYFEEGTIACKWCARALPKLGPTAFAHFERWMNEQVTNWAHCDDLGTHCLGGLILLHPEHLERTLPWLTSPNRWMRRAAAVSCILSGKRGLSLHHILYVAEQLLLDDDDLVRKGYGWLLKETSRAWPKEVFEFVLNHNGTMPRVALRYAIELLPKQFRAQAMAPGSVESGGRCPAK
jgi:3-methyladenine DNA glycosylase AlkD